MGQVPKITGSAELSHGREGEEGLVSPKVARHWHAHGCHVLTPLSLQVAVIVLIVAAAAIVWWIMSRRKRFGAVDVADLFEAVEVRAHKQCTLQALSPP